MISLGRGEPVIKPEEWVNGSKSPCDGVLLAFWGTPLDIGKEILEDVEEVDLGGVPVLRSIKGIYRGKTICIVQLYFGAPASAMALELLIAMGAREFIVYGAAGAVHPSVRVYDIVVPTWGVREEGTSYHYLPPYVVPRPGQRITRILQHELGRTAERLRVKLHTGGVWSTDAIFRETRDKVQRYSSMGVLAVDMESTALMAIAMYRRVELGIALVITDELHGKEWGIKWNVHGDKERRIEREVVMAAIRTLSEA
ncbi:nucleoside phosphorylase [Pyrodictium delaneyi]|nr:nucleoside phosphorylase [Pyrodictium delaneyi]